MSDHSKFPEIDELVAYILTDNRLGQGLGYLIEQGLEIDIKNIGAFLKWVIGDCLKEERDTIKASEITEKEFCQAANKKAKAWFFTQST